MGIVAKSVVFVCVALVLSVLVPYGTMFAGLDLDTCAYPKFRKPSFTQGDSPYEIFRSILVS